METHERGSVEGEGSLYSVQQTDTIGVKPTVKIQSDSADPGIVTVPTVSGGVSPDVSMLSTASIVSSDEEDKEEDEGSVHDDDEEDVDEINHEKLSEEVVRVHSPNRRTQRSSVLSCVKLVVSVSTYRLSDLEIFFLISKTYSWSSLLSRVSTPP